MSDFQWNSTEYDERWFHVLACLLARTKRQQDPRSTVDPGIGLATKNEDEDDSDCPSDIGDESATITPRYLVKERGKSKLLEKFLERLAEFMAHVATASKKSDDVCATAILEEEDHATVYFAKNGSLTEEDRTMGRQLQTWLQVTAALGERRDLAKDALWKAMVIWSAPRLLHYRKILASSFRAVGVTWSSETSETDGRLAAVQAFCFAEPAPAVQDSVGSWSEIITICYELRYEPSLLPYLNDCFNMREVVSPQQVSTLSRNLAFLGRLRSA